MAYSNEFLQIPGLLAGASLASNQFYVVKMASTAGEVVAVNATTDAAFGILLNDPADGEAAQIAISGSVKAKAGGTITAGAYLGFDSTARVVARTGDNSQIIGFAPWAASANDLVNIILYGHGRR